MWCQIRTYIKRIGIISRPTVQSMQKFDIILGRQRDNLLEREREIESEKEKERTFPSNGLIVLYKKIVVK